MRQQLAVLLLVLSLLPGCAYSRPAVQTLGAYDVLQPNLVNSPSGMRLQLAQPAYVQVLRTSPHGAEPLYPYRLDQQRYFEAGTHTLDIPVFRQAPSSGCASYEIPVSAYPDERDIRGGGITRTFTRRGQRAACYRSTARMEPYLSPVWHVLVLASEAPLQMDRVFEITASFEPPAGADPMESAAALAARLTEAEGFLVWAAHISSVRVR